MNSVIQFDHALQQAIASFRLPLLDVVAKFLDTIGDDIRLYLIVVVILLVWKKTRKLGLLILVTIIISTSIITITKIFVGRPRPFVFNEIETIINVTSYQYYASFPSGHTAGVACFVGTVCCYYKRYWGVGIVAICIMAWSRMYLHMHYPIDTIAGACIGLVTAYLVMEGSKRLEKLKTDKIKRSV